MAFDVQFSMKDFLFKKAYPFGNEYHAICHRIIEAMTMIELVEGKDMSQELGNCKYVDFF